MKPEKIIKTVCEAVGVPELSVLSRDRHKDVVEARNLIAFHLRIQEGLTYKMIGQALNCSTNSAASMVQRAQDFLEVDPKFIKKFQKVARRFE